MKETMLKAVEQKFNQDMADIRRANANEITQAGEQGRKAAVEAKEKELATEIVVEYEKAVAGINAMYGEPEQSQLGESPNE